MKSRMRCQGDHDDERRQYLIAAGVTALPVALALLSGAWEAAALLLMLPVMAIIVGAGYRGSERWRREASAVSSDRSRRR